MLIFQQYKDIGERFRHTLCSRFVNIYSLNRTDLLKLKDSREATRNTRPFKLDQDLMNREYALAASLAQRDKGKHYARPSHTPLVGKYGSKMAQHVVSGVHPLSLDLWSASKTGKSWKSSQTGWNAYSEFCRQYYDSDPIVKPTIYIVTHFAGYLYKLRGTSGKGCAATTVAGYISHVRTHFSAMGWKNKIWFDPRLTAIVSGAKHTDQVNTLPENRRRVLTFDILRIYADSLAREPLMPLEYLNLWTASLMYFWCSFRPSDLLPDSYDIQSTCRALRWGDIRVKTPDAYTILVRGPKTSETGGDDICNIVRFKQDNGKVYCPIYYLDFLMAQHNIMNRTFLKHEIVFRNENGKPMLQKQLNYQLKKHLWILFPDSLFTCYSLRAGLLNNYAEHSDKFTEEELRSTGKWQSDAMSAYLRTSGRRRDKAVTKIQGIFDEEVKKAFFSFKNLFSSLPCLSTFLRTPNNMLSLTVISQLV